MVDFQFSILSHENIPQTTILPDDYSFHESLHRSVNQRSTSLFNESVDRKNNPGQQASTTMSPVKVIIFAYYRSGSSLTGELFAQDKDTIYYFEPLFGMYYYLYGAAKGIKPFRYNDRTKR